jgi:hypothetical protein
MNGAEFVAVRRISNKANDTLAAVGERCHRVPAEALGWLEAKGAIRREPRTQGGSEPEGAAQKPGPRQRPSKRRSEGEE